MDNEDALLSCSTPKKSCTHLDKCRILLFKIVEQAVRDFLSLSKSSLPTEKEWYETACQFLFDDNYIIDYGGQDLKLKEILDILDIELEWLRRRILRLKDQQIQSFRLKRVINEDKEDIP